jgi:magnesium transporter
VTNWHDIRDPNSPQLDELAARYGLHPLHIEDCRHRNQNAKVEPQDNYIFVVLKPIGMDAECVINSGDLDLFLGTDYIITVQETECEALAQVLARTLSNQTNLRPDQIFYRILDGIVDSYLPILDRFSEEIDQLEDKVLDNPNRRCWNACSTCGVP